MSSRVSINSDDINVSITGGYGSDIITDTTVHIGTWRMMEVASNAVFTTFECENIYVNGAATTMDETDMPAIKKAVGAKTYGIITAVTLASGSVILYRC